MSVKLDDETIQEFKEAFSVFDKNGDGTISIDEIGEIFETFDLETSPEQMEKMMKEADIDGSGGIEFNEFLVLMTKKYERRDLTNEMRKMFAHFDLDKSGKISANELRESMGKLGMTLSVPEIQEMIACADLDGDGEVDYEEFLKIMERVS